MSLDGNKLANVQRHIMNKKRLREFELREIKEKVIVDVKDIDFRNLVITDGDVDDRDEGADGLSCTDLDTRVGRKRKNDQRENLNHIETLGYIPNDKVLKISLN